MGTRKYVASGALLAILFAPALLSALVFSELHLTPDGKFSAKGLTVMQKAGTNLFTRATWGHAFIRVTLLTNASTTIVKNHGEASTIDEIETGHLLDVEGELSSGADSLIIKASHVRNTALLRESKTLSGVITSIDVQGMSFVLLNSSFGASTVAVSPSTPIVKGARSIEFGDIVVGNSVFSTSGTYDWENNVLSANSLEVYQEKDIFTPRNFQGILKSVSGGVAPATLIVTVEDTDYTVYLKKESLVLSRDRQSTALRRFAEGDTVRFYGAIRETNFSEIDAEVVRDLDF